MNTRRTLLARGLLAACSPILASSAMAQEAYPVKPIHIVVPVAAGGGTDYTARLIAEKLGLALGQPVLVENRPGGSGNIGVQAVAHAPAEGYTLVMPITSFPINPSLQKLPFDTVKDFAPVVLAGVLPLMLVVSPQTPAKNVAELIELAKRNPGSINYANSGNGTTAHLAGELFNTMAGVKMVGVGYKGGGPAVTDLLGGHVQVYFSTIPSVLPHVEAGTLKALAVTSTKRLPELPNMPTVAEAGVPGFDVTAWFGLFAPAKTPRAVIELLNRETVKILAMPDVKEKMAAHGVHPGGGTPESLALFLGTEIDKWGKVVRDAGIQPQ